MDATDQAIEKFEESLVHAVWIAQQLNE